MAPVTYTCGDIDDVIKIVDLSKAELENIYSELESLTQEYPDDLRDPVLVILRKLDVTMNGLDVRWELEKLRKDNDSLRRWGLELEKEVESLKDELKDC